MKCKLKILLLVLIIGITSLYGCSKDNDQTLGLVSNTDNGQDNEKDKTSMGRFIEQKIALPEMVGNERIISILFNKNKQIEVYAYKDLKYKCYRLQEDMSWESAEPEWLNGDVVQDLTLRDICLGYDGNYYGSFINVSEKTVILKSPDEKTLQEVKIPYLEKMRKINDYELYPIIDKIQVMEDGSLVLQDMLEKDKLYVFSPDGKEIDNFRYGGSMIYASNYLTATNYIIAVMEDKKSIMLYDPFQSKIERSIEFEDIKDINTFALKNDGTLLLGNIEGIHRLQKDGSLWETTVDGSINSMSMPTLTFNALYVKEGEQEEYYGVFENTDDQFQLMHYVYDKNVASVPSKEITVYSLQENNTVRQAISLFQSQNTDIKVNYVVAMGEETENVSDYIRALNTELLAGNGADILILDGLPKDSYTEKGVLADLSDVLKTIDTKEQLLTNITDYYKKDGKIYMMPLRFSVPVIAGNEDAVQAADSLTSIVNYISNNNNKPYFDKTTYIQLLQECLALYSKDLIVNNQLNEDNMISFLKDMKSLAQSIEIEENSSYSTPAEIRSWLFESNGLFHGDVLSIIKRSQTAVIQVNNIENTVLLFAATQDTDNRFQTINQYFLPSGVIGLNNKAKEADIAKQFIRFLFEQETQDFNVYDGFPVNKRSMDDWINREKELYYGFRDDEGTELSGEWPNKEEREVFYQLIKNLNQPIDVNPLLNEIIIEATIPYLRGETDESQTLTAMKAKVNTFLAE